MRYTIQVDGNLYTVKIEEDPTHKETNETAEDIAYSALLSEYDHCVQRAEKLDNKVYILLTVCAFLFVLLTSVLAYWYLVKYFWLLLPFYDTIKETAVISYGKTKKVQNQTYG